MLNRTQGTELRRDRRIEPACCPHGDHAGHSHYEHAHDQQHAQHAHHRARAEPGATPVAAPGTMYTCPMHPQIRQPQPGNCPICGMPLEPEMPSLEEGPHPELVDFTRRFWSTLPLTAIVTLLAMAGHRLQWFAPAAQSWIELVLAAPVV